MHPGKNVKLTLVGLAGWHKRHRFTNLIQGWVDLAETIGVRIPRSLRKYRTGRGK